jgi:FkbM family methyltransferase
MTIATLGESLLRMRAGRRGAGLMLRLFGDVGFPLTTVRCRSTHGLMFRMDPTSQIDIEVICNGYYEPEILACILDHLPERGVLWDVGANVGIHALTVRALRPQVEVVAFEPVPITLARLVQHVSDNGLELKIMPVALGNEAGYLPMSTRLYGNSGIASLSPWPKSEYHTTLTVRVERGDVLVEKGVIPAPNMIKVDVEGFELQAFEGLARILSDPRLGTVIFESSEAKLGAVEALLASNEFSVSPVGKRNYVAVRAPRPHRTKTAAFA